MKMFTVTVKVSGMDTGKRFTITADVCAKHELEARTMALREISDKDLLTDANLLSVDITENLDRVNLVSIAATGLPAVCI
jgi:hypothetical protein